MRRCPARCTESSVEVHPLELTEEEALLRFQGDYTADINMFDRIENEAYKMADYMFCGIIKKCYR